MHEHVAWRINENLLIACRALFKLLPAAKAAQIMQTLSTALVNTISGSSGIANPQLPPAITALSIITRKAPEVLAQHADTLTQAVVDELLYDDGHAIPKGERKAWQKQGTLGLTGKALPLAASRPVIIKMSCLKVCLCLYYAAAAAASCWTYARSPVPRWASLTNPTVGCQPVWMCYVESPQMLLHHDRHVLSSANVQGLAPSSLAMLYLC